ncbi:hypothetical protein [Escherichia coli]|uniref:hypothetical protein n=1 Tax=Escherichia coli TaxID=562 RepID=UPI00388D1410
MTTQQDVDNFKHDFEMMLAFVAAHFPIGFKKTATSKTTPRARYEAIAVGTALALKTNPQLQSPAVPVGEWLFEEEFETLVTADSANNTSQLKTEYFTLKISC